MTLFNENQTQRARFYFDPARTTVDLTQISDFMNERSPVNLSEWVFDQIASYIFIANKEKKHNHFDVRDEENNLCDLPYESLPVLFTVMIAPSVRHSEKVSVILRF